MSGLKVYVASPYTKGDVVQNIKAAIDAGEELSKAGFVPFIPHLTAFWHLQHPHSYDFWIDYDNQWLPCCDALLRLPGESEGADGEVELAHKLFMPVFYSIGSLLEELGQ